MRLRVLGIAFVCALVLGATAASAAAAPTFTAPVQLGFFAGDDWEPSIAVDGHGHVYSFWNHYGDDPLCPGCASPHMELQISGDGGATWGQPRPLIQTSIEHHDPQIVVDPIDGSTVYTGFMQGSKSSMYVAKSTDFGDTWDVNLVETIERGTDKDILAVRGEYVVLVWNAVMKIYASVSHDGGETWTTVNVAPPTTNSKLGWSLPAGGAIDSKDNAYFAWSGYEGNGKPSGTVNLFLTKSSDGGRTWTTQRVDQSGAPPPCDCGGWAYWGSQMTVAVDNQDRVYVLYNASGAKFGLNRMFFRRSTDGGNTWSTRQDVSRARTGSNNLFPSIVARGNGDVRIAWQDDRNGFDSGGDDPDARWNTYYRSSMNGGTSWSSEAQLSRFVARYPYKFATPKDGYSEPYGDYFELDVDPAGTTHALWGEGPSYAGPGNVWYARGR
jgi:hypothetical protein